MVVSTHYVHQLHEISRLDAPRTGAKAANLGELLRAGFTVPEGFVLNSEAFERFRRVHNFDGSAAPADVAAARLPDDICDELIGAHTQLGDRALAVRSSGVAEDLAGASFAGQYETVLGVRGQAQLLDAVARCWSSAFAERVTAYRKGRINGDVPPMALLVQRLIEPDAAGVAFTVNPVTGNRDEVVVSAVRGLGDRLVAGEVQPDEWIVSGAGAECRQSPEDAVGPEHVLLIADLARRIEAHFGSAQDIEWALAGDKLYLLQARPVTGLPSPSFEVTPPPVDVPAGFWQREATHFPRPLTPMASSSFLDIHNTAMREMFSTYGLLLEAVEMRELGGWMYARAVPLGGTDRKAPPASLMWLLVRLVPQLRRRVADCREAIRGDLHGQHIERWYAEWQPDLARRIGTSTARDLASLSDAAVAEHLDALLALCDDCVRVHFLLHGAMVMVLGEFAFTCRDLLGWEDRRMLELLNGLSEMSSEPARRLAQLASIGAHSASMRPMLGRLDNRPTDEVIGADAGFAEAFRAYQRDYGCRALGYEVVEPTLAEKPELILQLVRDQVLRGYDPDLDSAQLSAARATALGEARAALVGRDEELLRFENALARARRAYPVREDSEFYTVSAPLGLLRYAVLELGRRLADRGQTAAVDDVFMLAMPEARSALISGVALHQQVARRQADRAQVLAHPGPPSYGAEPGPPPPTSSLPKEARFAMDALQWVMLDRILAVDDSQRRQAAGDRLTGISASVGRYTGPVRVVMDETQFGKVQAGDVLVCPITSPVWSVLFPSIGALVTDTGGILSHAAIIAREYRLPAVVGTGNATSLLRDGQQITVDGDAGLVMSAFGDAGSAARLD
jgi:rifampicin phosphotransferase